MVPSETPGDAVEGPTADLVSYLDSLVEANRRALFEPWRESLGAGDDLGSEMEQTVKALQVFFTKWTVEIVVVLARGTFRFNELKHALGGISSRTLSQRLRDLEAQGFVHRAVHDEMPVRVEYSLTSKGRDVATLALPVVLYLTLAQHQQER